MYPFVFASDRDMCTGRARPAISFYAAHSFAVLLRGRHVAHFSEFCLFWCEKMQKMPDFSHFCNKMPFLQILRRNRSVPPEQGSASKRRAGAGVANRVTGNRRGVRAQALCESGRRVNKKVRGSKTVRKKRPRKRSLSGASKVIKFCGAETVPAQRSAPSGVRRRCSRFPFRKGSSA